MIDWTTWKYEPKTPEELKDIAVGIAEGRIFTDRHVKEEDAQLLPQVFVSLEVADSSAFRRAMEREEIELFYANRDAAGPWKIKGYPVFLSCGFLNKAEIDFIKQMIRTSYEETENSLAEKRRDTNERESE